MNRPVLLPGATVGVLGGGQLGRMIAGEAQRMGYRVLVLDPDPACPAAAMADEVVAAPWSDLAAAQALAAKADVLTVETEHIPWQLLRDIEQIRPLHPAAAVLRTVQDRLVQKRFLASHDIAQPAFVAVDDADSLQAAVTEVGTPAVLKTRHGGYDGKGQARIRQPDEALAAWRSIGQAPAVLERFVAFRTELSVVLARGRDGELRFYPVAENEHRGGILHVTRAPAPLPPAVCIAAEELAGHVARALDHVGVLAVEMFLLPDDTLLVNEVAPRVHNSGHFTLGACATSQFEQHLRAVCGLPLGDQSQLCPAAMLNLLGDLWRQPGGPDWRPVLANPHARLHLYGKRTPSPGRKMGHVLVLHPDADEALAMARDLHARLQQGAGLAESRQ